MKGIRHMLRGVDGFEDWVAEFNCVFGDLGISHAYPVARRPRPGVGARSDG